LRISSPANRTFANFSMTHGFALSISSTWIPWPTKCYTLVHYAGLVVRTFRIMITISNFSCSKKWKWIYQLQFKFILKVLVIQNHHLRVSHFWYGSPFVPGGHVHKGLWFETVHVAVELHGLFVVQGFTQLLPMQALSDEHSSSDEQPTTIGAA